MEAVTVTVLDVELGLVHIPRHRLHHFSHPIIKHILAPKPAFLNISCNATEVSIIASRDSLAAFKRVAKRDRKRLAKIQASSPPGRRRRSISSPLDIVQVSEPWSAIQIDSREDQVDTAVAARIREISALLAGISILYQSSHATDYIFVQSDMLPSVLKILTDAGYMSPSDSEALSSTGLHLTLTSSSPSPSSFHSSLQFGDVSSTDDTHFTNDTPTPVEPTSTSHYRPLRSKSFSSGSTTPRIPSVQILDEDLVVVALSDQAEDQEAWTMKLIKLLLFPDTISEPTSRRNSDFASSIPQDIPLSYSSSFSGDLDDSLDGESAESFEESSFSSSSFSSSSCCSASSSSSSSSSSCSLHQPTPRHLRSDSSYTKASSTSESISHSQSPISPFFSKGENSRSPSSTTPPTSPQTSKFQPERPPIVSTSRRRGTGVSTPFFSLTRTSDSGTSLTSDIRLLAKLFPPGPERALIWCKDEFELLERLQERELERGREKGKARLSGVWGARTHHHYGSEEDLDKSKGFLKCLHVDLQAFGLGESCYLI
ncbi:hypothetical protein FRC03_005586 [Tulasnella sp. 419]|nr:hypothetical protein FRC03_005586 [Tulasnella sp. 419]